MAEGTMTRLDFAQMHARVAEEWLRAHVPMAHYTFFVSYLPDGTSCGGFCLRHESGEFETAAQVADITNTAVQFNVGAAMLDAAQAPGH